MPRPPDGIALIQYAAKKQSSCHSEARLLLKNLSAGWTETEEGFIASLRMTKKTKN